jgi:predicted deacylase
MRAAPSLAMLPLLGLALAGCIATPSAIPTGDAPWALLGDFYDRTAEPAEPYHAYDELTGRIAALAQEFPGLARLEQIGESHQGRPITALVIGQGAGAAPLTDGGHHPNELEGVASVLYAAEFVLRHHATNATVRSWVEGRELWFVPLVNPDGYVAQSRFNAAGVNLNRNYDLAWCHAAAWNTCLPRPVHEAAVGAGANPPEYAGEGPFSEPESRAIRDLVLRLGPRLAFYLTHHTDLHCIFGPWVAPDAGAPWPIPPEHQAVLEAVYAWTRANTEFGGGDAAWFTGDCVGYNHGGGSMDWVYAHAGVPAFTMETAGNRGRENINPVSTNLPNEAWPRDLAHWMEATLPVELLFLHNIDRLKAWDTDLVDPPPPPASTEA